LNVQLLFGLVAVFILFDINLKRKTFTQMCLWRGIFLLFASTTAGAQSSDLGYASNQYIEDFNDLEVIVPFLPGGGSDIWARTVLPSLGEFLPGKPQLLIKNIIGSRGHRAANDYARINPLHGRSLFVIAASMNIAYLLEDERVRYDLSNWRALMAYSAGIVVYASPNLGIQQIRDLKDSEQHLIMASIGPTSEDLFVLLAFDLLEIDITSIFGLGGRGAARKMFERGDVNLDFQTTPAFMKFVNPLVNDHKAKPLFSLGAFDSEMNYVRDPHFPDLPNLKEVYKEIFGFAPKSEAWDAWLSIYKATKGTLKFLVIPKETPENIISSYQTAIDNMLKDQTLLNTLNSKVGVNTISGTVNAQKLMQEMIALPTETRTWLKQWIHEKYQIRI
jgi:tripartite-type tricarboxylate transporter receptor subunit TctC